VYDIANGVVSYRPHSQVADLDHAGAPPICTMLRSKVIFEQERGGEFDYHDGLFIAPAYHDGDLRIQRCHGHDIILKGPGVPENPDARSGLLTWDTGHPAENFAEEELLGGPKNGQLRRGKLVSYEFRSHRRHSWALPRLTLQGENAGLPTTGVFGYSTHTKYMVFWVAARYCKEDRGGGCTANRFAVYAASIK
jgi:hypothetical protein